MKIGLLINHGIEVRYYLLSGLLHYLKEQGHEAILIVPDVPSSYLREYIDLFNIKYEILPTKANSTSKYDALARSVGNARKRSSNTKIYHHYGADLSTPKWYDSLFKIPGVSLVADNFFRKKLSITCHDKNIVDFFSGLGLNRLYMLQYSSPFLKRIGASAAAASIDIYVFINTLKTVFIDDFVPFNLARLFAWNKEQCILFEQGNKGLKKSIFKNTGSPYHNFLMEEDAEIQLRVMNKYGLSPNTPFILYSLINEKVYNDEYSILKFISDQIEHLDIDNKPYLIIRRNPFEVSDTHIQKIAKLQHIIVADHYWERDEAREWSIQGIEGELEWRALLQLASLSMNIPSMSTIDSILCGTPVLNIGFEASGNYNDKLRFLIESPFNEEFEKSKCVKTFRSSDGFVDTLQSFLSIKEKLKKSQIVASMPITTSHISAYTN